MEEACEEAIHGEVTRNTIVGDLVEDFERLEVPSAPLAIEFGHNGSGSSDTSYYSIPEQQSARSAPYVHEFDPARLMNSGLFGRRQAQHSVRPIEGLHQPGFCRACDWVRVRVRVTTLTPSQMQALVAEH